MKYILIILVLGGAYYQYQKNELWTDEGLISALVEKNDELCSMPELLNEKDITKDQCKIIFTLKIDECADVSEQKYPGDKFESKEQFEQAGKEVLNCIVRNMSA